MMATVQLRNTTDGRAYDDRKKANGTRPTEAMRCFRRRLSDTVYRTTLTDLAAHAARHAGTGPGGHRDSDSDSSATGSQPRPVQDLRVRRKRNTASAAMTSMTRMVHNMVTLRPLLVSSEGIQGPGVASHPNPVAEAARPYPSVPPTPTPVQASLSAASVNRRSGLVPTPLAAHRLIGRRVRLDCAVSRRSDAGAVAAKRWDGR
jgi:hypothetical protein